MGDVLLVIWAWIVWVVLEYMCRSSSDTTMSENLVPHSGIRNDWKHRKVDRVWAKVGAILCALVNTKMLAKLNPQEAKFTGNG